MSLGLNNLEAFMLSQTKRGQIYFILYVKKIMKITTFRLMVLLCVVMTSANALAEARAPQKAEAFYHEGHEDHEGKPLRALHY